MLWGWSVGGHHGCVCGAHGASGCADETRHCPWRVIRCGRVRCQPCSARRWSFIFSAHRQQVEHGSVVSTEAVRQAKPAWDRGCRKQRSGFGASARMPHSSHDTSSLVTPGLTWLPVSAMQQFSWTAFTQPRLSIRFPTPAAPRRSPVHKLQTMTCSTAQHYLDPPRKTPPVRLYH